MKAQLTLHNVYNVDITLSDRDSLLFLFSLFLSEKYENIDLVNTFNTYQQKIRTMCERFQLFTITSNFVTQFSYFNFVSIIAPRFKDIIEINFIDKVDFYRSVFGSQDLRDVQKGEDCVYLMLNTRNSLIKIGKSNNPLYREKTLQGQEPEIVLIAYWMAPAVLEKELQANFIHRRARGEWFKLNFSELKKIQQIMIKYEKNEQK